MIFPTQNNLLSRRAALRSAACGFGSLALGALAHRAAASDNPLAAKLVHHAPKAKRVIFIFMAGGVSHVDSFDYKQKLFDDDGKMVRFDDARTLAKTRKIVEHAVKKPLWKFKNYGNAASRLVNFSRTWPSTWMIFASSRACTPKA